MKHCHIRKNGENNYVSIYRVAKINNCSKGWLYDLFNGVWDKKISSGAPVLWKVLTNRGYNPFQFSKHGIPPGAQEIISTYVNQRRQLKNNSQSS